MTLGFAHFLPSISGLLFGRILLWMRSKPVKQQEMPQTYQSDTASLLPFPCPCLRYSPLELEKQVRFNVASPCIVLTAVGQDRPGLVNELSSVIHQAGANLEDTRMAILGGEFAVLMLVTGSEQALKQVRNGMERVENELGLKVMLKATERPKAPRDYLAYSLRVSGVDHPGIVHHVAEILAGRQVNVRNMETRLSFAPLSGTPMFQLEAELEVPSKLMLSVLRRELSEMCDDHNLDFGLEAR